MRNVWLMYVEFNIEWWRLNDYFYDIGYYCLFYFLIFDDN